LSLEKHKSAEAEPVKGGEGNMCGTVMQGAVALPWSKTPSRRKGSCRNLRGLASDRSGKPYRPASGRPKAERR